MSYGLVIKNTSGGVQIDNLYRNHQLVAKGARETVATTAPVTYHPGISVLEIPYSGGVFPIVIVANGAEALTAYPSRPVAGATSLPVQVMAPLGTTISYWVFDYGPTPPPAGSMGLKVFNDSGDLCYFSGYKYLRIFDIVSGSDYRTDTLEIVLPDDGRTYGFIPMKVGSRQRYSAWQATFNSRNTDLTTWALFWKQTGRVITGAEYQQFYQFTGNVPGASPTGEAWNETCSWSVIIADLTNY